MKAKDKTIHILKLISEKTLGNSFTKADLKMNLVIEVEKPFLLDGLIKGFSKIIIDLEKKDKTNLLQLTLKQLKNTQKVI